MKSMRLVSLFFFCAGTSLFAQVSEIKQASSSVSSRSDGSGAGGGGVVTDIIFNIVFGEIIQAQQQKLDRRNEVPGMISVDAIFQGTINPSSYYVLQPRVRGNWGLFSTDFRFNYLLEEGIGEIQHIRTNDWQILEFNVVTTRDAIFRVGGGVMHEAFGGGKSYVEWSTSLDLHPARWRVGCQAEYRDADVRKEVSASVAYHLFDQGTMHGFVTAGALYQKYYSSVEVWGIAGGMMVKLY
jgi:hypothetical protein